MESLRHHLKIGCTTLLLFATAVLSARAQPVPHRNDGPRAVEGELLVKFRGGPRGLGAERAQRELKHEVKRRFDRVGWQHIKLPPGTTEALYRRHPEVIAAEPNYVFQLRNAETSVVPNDPRLNEQWALGKIGATNAWALTKGSPNVVVAVLDTGIRYTHEDMAGNMWRNPGEIPGNQ